MTNLATYDLDGRIATITADDGKANAFSIPMLEALHAALDRAESDGAIVVLAGRDRFLSGGFDLGVFQSGDGDALLRMLTLGATLAERILAFPTPVVVACTGHAMAAGTFPLLAADARVGAAGPFRLGLNEVRIGLTLPWFAIELARHRLTTPELDRATVSAATYDPAGAAAAGFLDRVVEPDAVLEEARAIATELAELDPAAHAATKLRVRGDAIAAVRAAIERELTPPA